MINKLRSKLHQDKHFSELLKGSAISFILRIIGILLGYVFVLLVTRGYGAEAMGVFTLAFTFLQITSIISRLGMDTIILRFTSESISHDNRKEFLDNIHKKILFITLPLSLFITTIAYITSPTVATYIFDKPELTTAFQLTSLGILPMSMLFIHREALRGLKMIMLYSFFSNIALPLFSCLLLLFLLYFSTSNLMPIYAQLSAITISGIASFFLWRHYANQLKNKSTSAKKTMSLVEILKISLPMMLASSLFMVMSWADVLILGAFRTTEEVGIYSVALKVSLLTSIVLMAINSIAAPKFAEMWGKKDLKGLESIVKQSTKMIFLLSLPILIFILIFPKFILSFFGNQFELGSTALILLTLGQFFNAISGSVGMLLTMTGYQVIYQNILVFTIIVNIFLNLLLVTEYGLVGVAIATMVSTILWNSLMGYFIWKKFGFTAFYTGVK